MRFFLSTAAVLLLGTGWSWAQAIPQGSEFPINTGTIQTQSRSSIAIGDAGEFVVVWESLLQDGNSWGVFGQRFDAAAAPQGVELAINTYTSGSQRIPQVGRDALGDFVVVWTSFGQVPSGYFDIFAQRFDSSGVAALEGELAINTDTVGFQNMPDVGMDAVGNFVVVWDSQDQDGSSYGVLGQRYDSSGSPQGAEFPINVYTTSGQSHPAVAMTTSGTFVVVWQSFGQDGSGYGIIGRQFDAAALPLGGEFQVNHSISGHQAYPAVDVDASGAFVVAWEGLDSGGDAGIFAQRFDSSGTRRGGEIRADPETAAEQRNPAVAIGDGNFVVAWEHDSGVSGYEVVAAVFDSDAVRQGQPFQVNTYTSSDQIEPAVDMTSSGDFVLSWTSGTQDGSGSGIYGQRYCIQPPVSDLFLEPANGGVDLFLTWTDTPNADDYEVLEGTLPGVLTTVTGVAASGVTGLTTPMPGSSTFYVVTGRASQCTAIP